MNPESRFLLRFEQILSSLRRYQARLGLALTALAASTCLGGLAWLDFRLELPRPTRALGLALGLAGTMLVIARHLVGPIRWWTGQRTAVEIEQRFPQLGQRIRTVVQYGGRPVEVVLSEGVAPSLLEALEGETEARVTPLSLGQVVPWRRAYLASGLALIPITLLIVLAARSHDWRVAIARAVLVDRPYTTIQVNPGDVLVDQGADVPVEVVLEGRPRKSVVLETRPAGGKPDAWKGQPLDGPASALRARVEKVKDPVEYRVVAGPASSGSYQIKVRYPLAIKAFEVLVTPPAYTRIKPSKTKGGDIQGFEGSVAKIQVAFDAPTDHAALEMVAPSAKGQPPTVIPLAREGDAMVATVALTRNLDYKVVATTVDGRSLPKNKYRIDVREDRAPRVSFDEPDESLEVHPIAEVLHRARVADDIGLARAGIVFRFNDGDEKTLSLQDFATPEGQKLRRAGTLEGTLLLETLAATPQDSVTYYAFAEDNFPGDPHRTETDLRYIDLRSFKREYKLGQPGSEGDMDEGETSASLMELIARQRVNLNRATRLARHKPTDRAAAEDPLKVAGFEETLVNMTREFTEGIEALADARVDSLHKALDAMQAAVDALDRAKFADAPPTMAEALKHLIAARRELAEIIGDNPALAAAIRAFDRKQAQKIRKPKSKDELAEEIAAKLEELADEEDFIYASIAAGTGGVAPGGEGKKGEKPKPDAKPEDPAETKKSEPAKAEAAKGDEGEKAEGDKGKDGDKGQGGEGKDGDKGQGGEGQGGEGQGGEGKGDARGAGKDTPKGPDGMGKDDDGDGTGEPKKSDRKSAAEKQEQVGDDLKDLEDKLKKVESVSDLARARMTKASEQADKASGAFARGNTKEAGEDAKVAAGMLHELARQIKGEIQREAAQQVALARDLAQELADREANLASKSEGPAGEGEKGDKPGKGQGKGSGGPGGWEGLSDEERVDRMAEAAKTLAELLKQIQKRGDGKASEAVGEILEQGNVAEIVERSVRMGEVRGPGPKPEVAREAKELSTKLEGLAQALEILHRGIVAPQLAAMVEFDRRLAELTARLADLKTEAQVAEWQGDAAGLVRDLEKANVAGATELADALRTLGSTVSAGGWQWDAAHAHLVPTPGAYAAIQVVGARIKDEIQEMILKDLASARDEATPPMFRELVERYYEVLSRGK